MAGCKTLCAQFRTERSSMDSILFQGVESNNPGEPDVLRMGIIHSIGGEGEPDSEGWTEQLTMAGEVELTREDAIMLRRMLDLWLGYEY
jgi:hypothetical protein